MSIMTGKEGLIQILLAEETKYIFGIPGATEVVFMDALEDHPEIKFILGPHETVAMGMAEGYARTSGKVGITNFHTNTGLAASLPLLYNALQGGVPLIVTAGQQDTRLAAQDPALRADLVGIARPFTKWAAEVVNTEDIPQVMRQAFKTALQPPQGPVFVSLPQNLLEGKLDFSYSRGALRFTRTRPDAAAVKLAIDLLGQARKPVMLVEDGVTKNNALADVVKLAELCGARVYQQWMADVNFPVNHPLYLGDLDVNSLRTREILESADLLIVIGSLFFSQAIYTPQPLVPPGLKIIQIDDDPRQIGKNYPVTAGLQGNIKLAVQELIAGLQAGLSTEAQIAVKARIQEITVENDRIKQSCQAQAAKEKDNVPIAATRLIQEIRDVIPAGTRIVDDCWSYSAVLRRTLNLTEAGSYQRARGGGSIGWGLPGSLGAKLASPDSPVVCVSGDGSALWSIQSLWTAAHYQIPVTFVICANGIYRQVRVMKSRIMGDQAKGRDLGTDISAPRTDFVGIARSFGIKGARVEKPDEIGRALKTAVSSNQPCLVEVTVEGGN